MIGRAVENHGRKAAQMNSRRARLFARLRRFATTAVVACAGLGFLGAGTASAEFAVDTIEAPAFDQDGNLELRAGARPYEAQNTIVFTQTTNPGGMPIPDGNVKDVIVDLPPGFGGNPQNVPKCAQQELMPDLNVGELTR